MTGERESSATATLPSGVLTVMFTDLEESALRWELDAAEMRRVMNVHDDVLDRAVLAHGGVVFKSTGDGIGAVFSSPGQAVEAAVTVQRLLQGVPWRSERPRVRIGMHLGDISPTRGDYYGADVNRAARIMDVANGDQIAVSAALAEFIAPERRTACGEHELRGIGSESIHLVREPDLIDDTRPLRAVAIQRTPSLPPGLARSVGRSLEVDEIAELVRTNRLVTVVGVGGVGKTHVGLAVGRRLEPSFADGAVFVELGSVRHGDDVAPAVAAALGARLQPGLDLLDSIADYVNGRELLVLIDNCEHVLDSARAVISCLLESTNVVVLSTSRSSFGDSYEQVYPLAPLASRDGSELFADRSASRDPRLVPTTDEREVVARICAAVGGIPLGIELAAAWVRVLPLGDIADRLERSLDVARLQRIATAGEGRQGARQETLRSTIEWSYLQLTEREALLFDRLSVFVGGFSIDAAQAVCAGDELEPDEITALLMALVDASMVTVERAVHDRRFSTLRPLQLFGRDNLSSRGEVEVMARRHARFFATAVSEASARLVTDDEHEVWDWLAVEWANVRETFSRLRLDGQLNDAAQLLVDLGWHATLSVRSEVFAWADELLAGDRSDDLDAKASLLGLRALHKYFVVDPDSRSDAELGLRLDGADPDGYCRIALGAVWVNNQHAAHESELWTNEWLASLTPNSPAMSKLWAHGMRAFHLCVHDPLSPSAREHVEAIEAMAVESGSTSARVLAHWARGMYAVSTTLEHADDVHASTALDEWRAGRELAESLSEVHLLAHLITSLELHFTAADGSKGDAVRLARDALRRAHNHHYLAGTSHLFGVTAIVLAQMGNVDVARRLLPVMVANGHPPRQNALDAVAPAHGDGLLHEPPTLSIHEAAQLADIALSQSLKDPA